MSGSNNDDDNNYEDDDDSDNNNNNHHHHHPSPIKESLFAGNCKNLKKSARYLRLWQMIIDIQCNELTDRKSKYYEERDTLIKALILRTKKFLQFDWLRAEVFHLNFKNYSYYGNENYIIISSRKLRKKWWKDVQVLKENQNTKKNTFTLLNVWPSWAKNNNFQSSLPASEAKQLNENKQMV